MGQKDEGTKMNHPAVCIEVIASGVQYAVSHDRSLVHLGILYAGSEETVNTSHGHFLTIMAILMMIVTCLDLVLSM